MEQTTKPITSEQRRMLSKLYEKKVDARLAETRSAQNVAREQLEKSIIKEDFGHVQKLVDKFVAAKEAIKIQEQELEDAVRKEKHLSYHSYSERLSLDRQHPSYTQLTKTQDKQLQDMDEAKDRIMVEVWGLSGSYNELLELIEKEFKAIGV